MVMVVEKTGGVCDLLQAQVEGAQPTKLRVVLLDFGNAIPCTSCEDQLDEEEELITALCG
jgi:hypothetical protein